MTPQPNGVMLSSTAIVVVGFVITTLGGSLFWLSLHLYTELSRVQEQLQTITMTQTERIARLETQATYLEWQVKSLKQRVD